MDANVSAALLAQSQNIIPKLQQMENDPNWAASGDNNGCAVFKI